jgi:hypothetical protein
MDERFHNTDNLGGSLGSVDRAETGGSFAVVSVGFEDIPVAFALGAKDVAHCGRSTKTAATAGRSFWV